MMKTLKIIKIFHLKDNADDEKFTNDMKNLFNDVKDVKKYNPDDNNDDFEGNENVPSEK